MTIFRSYLLCFVFILSSSEYAMIVERKNALSETRSDQEVLSDKEPERGGSKLKALRIVLPEPTSRTNSTYSELTHNKNRARRLLQQRRRELVAFSESIMKGTLSFVEAYEPGECNIIVDAVIATGSCQEQYVGSLGAIAGDLELLLKRHRQRNSKRREKREGKMRKRFMEEYQKTVGVCEENEVIESAVRKLPAYHWLRLQVVRLAEFLEGQDLQNKGKVGDEQEIVKNRQELFNAIKLGNDKATVQSAIQKRLHQGNFVSVVHEMQGKVEAHLTEAKKIYFK